MKLTKRQLRKIIREEKQKLLKENSSSWMPTEDDGVDGAGEMVMYDCLQVLSLAQEKMAADARIYGAASLEDFIIECLETIKLERLTKTSDLDDIL